MIPLLIICYYCCCIASFDWAMLLGCLPLFGYLIPVTIFPTLNKKKKKEKEEVSNQVYYYYYYR
jgi:hypothetical protein